VLPAVLPRSAPTVDAEGKRSLEVQGNALFRHLLPTSLAIKSSRLAAHMHRQTRSDAGKAEVAVPSQVEVVWRRKSSLGMAGVSR
jgi:hypothetical protein